MRNVLIYIAIFGIMTQASCSPLIQHEESTLPFGDSVHLAVQQQILNPDAGSDAPVVGLDGKYAAKVGTKYQQGPSVDPNAGQSVSELVIEAK